jgi:hypothetical protein
MKSSIQICLEVAYKQFRRCDSRFKITDSPFCYLNTFTAIVDLSRFNNSCLRLLKISDYNNE